MATGVGTQGDFVLYDEQYRAGWTEVMMQRSTELNGSVLNTITMINELLFGDFEKESFFLEMTNLLTYRNPASTSAATIQKLEMAEQVGVKIPRKLGPVRNTASSWKKAVAKAGGMEMMSFILGQQAAKAQSLDYLNTAILCLLAAINGADGGGGTLVYDGSAGTFNRLALNAAKALFGDASQSLVLCVMHSKVYHDYIGAAVTNSTTLFEEGIRVVDGGQPGAFGMSYLVTDSPALVTAGTPNIYHTLLLAPGAAQIKVSEADEVLFNREGGNENIEYLWQAENAYNMSIRGIAYDTGAGADPTDATLGSSGNWTQIATDIKSTAGVVIDSQ